MLQISYKIVSKKLLDVQERFKDAQLQLKEYEGADKPKPIERLASAMERLRRRNVDYAKLKTMYVMLSGRNSLCEKRLVAAERQVDTLTTRLNLFLASEKQLTPRPLWTEIIPEQEQRVIFEYDTTRERSATIAELYYDLKEAHKEATTELLDARKFIGLESDQSLYTILNRSDPNRDNDDDNEDDETPDKKWFLGLGADEKIPPYLRYAGKILNRCFTKRQTELAIKEYWERKESYERENFDGRRVDAKEFFEIFLKGKVNPDSSQDIKRVIAEWSYSMMFALKKWIRDPDCETFYKIMFEDMDQEVYYDQVLMIVSLKQSLEDTREEIRQRDNLVKAQDQARKQMRREMEDYDIDMSSDDDDDELLLKDEEYGIRKPRKSIAPTLSDIEIPKKSMINVLRRMFPVKSDEYFHKLCVCLNRDFPGNVVDYVKLFEEDEQCNQSDLVEELRRQQVMERDQYLTELSDHIIDQDGNNDGSVTVQEIQAALKIADPNMPADVMDKLIARGMNVDVEDLGVEVGTNGEHSYKGRLLITITTFMERLRLSQVRRYTKPPPTGELASSNQFTISISSLAPLA
jgi:hypothetical protein